MLKTVLFDLDGTLLDTAEDFTQILNKLLKQHDHQEVSGIQVRETVSDGARALIRLGFGIDESNPNFPFLLKNFLKLYDEVIPQTQCSLFDGIAPLLKRIENENCLWGVVTNKPSRFTTPLLERFPEFQSCSVVICPDDVNQAKPDPEGILLACNQAKCQTAEAIYVGDHARDIKAGINAKMPTVAVQWGYFPNDTILSDWNADKIVSHPDELQHFLFG